MLSWTLTLSQYLVGLDQLPVLLLLRPAPIQAPDVQMDRSLVLQAFRALPMKTLRLCVQRVLLFFRLLHPGRQHVNSSSQVKLCLLPIRIIHPGSSFLLGREDHGVPLGRHLGNRRQRPMYLAYLPVRLEASPVLKTQSQALGPQLLYLVLRCAGVRLAIAGL